MTVTYTDLFDYEWPQLGTLSLEYTLDSTANATLAVAAMNAWEAVADIEFESGGDDIVFYEGEPGSTDGIEDFGLTDRTYLLGYLSETYIIINDDYNYLLGTNIGSERFSTYIHEVGHALGLGHPDDNGSNPNYDESMTVMSYRNIGHSISGASNIECTTPMVLDIQAIQSLYGAKAYDPLDNYSYDGTAAQALTIWDTGNDNNLIASSYAGGDGVLLDLRQGIQYHSKIGDTFIWIANDYNSTYTTHFYNATGSSGADTITGNDFNNSLQGGDGNDTITGNSGNDTLTGGAGNDTLEGGDDADTYLFGSSGIGIDTIIDSGSGNVIKISDINISGTWTTNIATGAGLYVSGWRLDNTYSYMNFAFDGSKLYKYQEKVGITGTPYTAWNPATDAINISEGSLSSFGILLSGEYSGTAGNDTVTGTQHNDVMLGLDGLDTINGGAGNDSIEGGSGNDILTGGLGDDALVGNGGNDIFNWALGDGNDTVTDAATGTGTDKVKITTSGLTISDFDVYGTVGQHVVIKNIASGETITLLKQFDTDSGYRIETLEFADTSTFNLVQAMNWKGTSGNDTLEAATATFNDTMFGYEGNDTIDGKGGNDTIYGGNDNDTLLGGDGTDTLYGDDGNDLINGGAGADAIDGGNGTDRVYFTGSTNGVTVNLTTGIGSGNIAAGDTYTNIEDVSASAYADNITGDSNNNTIWGNDGNDTINGAGGNDTIYGGDNNDTIDGGTGSDTIDGGSGTDNLTYANSSAGVTVNLTTNTNTGGDAASDSITNIENIYGSLYADVITGNSSNNFIFGDQGNDELRGEGGTDTIQGGTGADIMYGGAGNDTFKFTGIAESSSTNLDMIMDWATGDKIALTGAGIAANFAGLSVAVSGTGVLVSDIDSSFQLYVEGVSSLSSTDFIF